MLQVFHQKYLVPMLQFTETSRVFCMNLVGGWMGVFVGCFQLLRCISSEFILGFWSPWNKLPSICVISSHTSALALYCNAQLLVPISIFRALLVPVLIRLMKCDRCKWQQPENTCERSSEVNSLKASKEMGSCIQ